jgi:fumarate reductase flavoprotein subunit
MNSRSISLLLTTLIFLGTTFAAPSAPSSGMLAQKHLDAGITCKQCHATGIPAKSVSTKQVPKIATAAACLKCHGTYKQIAERTKGYDTALYNPHVSHYGELDCYQCHRVHTTSEMFCTACHLEMKVPAKGWKPGKNPADE